jgi:hypothetical protein
MKLKIGWVIMAIILLSIPTYTTAAPVLDETVGVFGSSWESFSFVADQTPLVYQVTLTDFEYPAPFVFLGVAITTNSTDKVAELFAPGTKMFPVKLGETYVANVLSSADNNPPGGGLFGINITAVPVPPALLLLGSGLFALFALRKRN